MVVTNAYFVKNTAIIASPSDSWDGRDPFGFALSTASWTTATNVLDETGAFTGYTFTAGDQIYLTHASITNGLYPIASKIDDDSITLGESISGSDQTNVVSSNGPWLSLQFVADTIATGDSVCYICADGEYQPSALIDWDTNTCTASAPYTFRGATTRGVFPPISNPIISATALGGTIDLFYFQLANQPIFECIDFKGGSGGQDLISTIASSIEIRLKFINCNFYGAGRHAVYSQRWQHEFIFIDCNLYDNAQWACYDAGVGLFCGHFTRCSIHDNGSGGTLNTTGWSGWPKFSGIYVDCTIYDNGGPGIQFREITDGARGLIVKNCTIERNTDGIRFSDSATPSGSFIENNVIANNSAYGINYSTASDHKLVHCRRNVFYNNTSGDINVGSVPDLYSDNVFSTDPGFASVVDGSEDYVPGAGSILLTTAGLNGPRQ